MEPHTSDEYPTVISLAINTLRPGKGLSGCPGICGLQETRYDPRETYGQRFDHKQTMI